MKPTQRHQRTKSKCYNNLFFGLVSFIRLLGLGWAMSMEFWAKGLAFWVLFVCLILSLVIHYIEKHFYFEMFFIHGSELVLNHAGAEKRPVVLGYIFMIPKLARATIVAHSLNTFSCNERNYKGKMSMNQPNLTQKRMWPLPSMRRYKVNIHPSWVWNLLQYR